MKENRMRKEINEILDIVQKFMAQTTRVVVDKPVDYQRKLVVIGGEATQSITTYLQQEIRASLRKAKCSHGHPMQERKS